MQRIKKSLIKSISNRSNNNNHKKDDFIDFFHIKPDWFQHLNGHRNHVHLINWISRVKLTGSALPEHAADKVSISLSLKKKTADVRTNG